MRKYFPVSLNVFGRKCLVIGGDEEAVSRSTRLLSCGAQVRVVSREVKEASARSLRAMGAAVDVRELELGDFEGVFLVLLCIQDNPSLSERVQAICKERRILLCAVDQPEFCDFINVAIVEKGGLQMTASTGGRAPAVSSRIREGLQESLAYSDIDLFLEEVERLRIESKKQGMSKDARSGQVLDFLKGFAFKVSVDFPDWWIRSREKDNK